MDLSLNNLALVVFLSLSLSFCLFPGTVLAKLRKNYYHKTCPNVENIVRDAVTKKFQQTFVTAPATIRLFFHDCFVQGCDASVMIASSGGNKAEKDHPDNFSLAGDGFDTVIKAKEAVDAVPSCRNKVSCADILAMATRDAIALLGGPYYEVEQGRLDGLSSTAGNVNGKLPQPFFNLNQLNSLFAANGLTQKKHDCSFSGPHCWVLPLQQVCEPNTQFQPSKRSGNCTGPRLRLPASTNVPQKRRHQGGRRLGRENTKEIRQRLL